MDREKARAAQSEVCKTAKAMYNSGLVAGTWGNISARIDDEYMAITPSGMDYDGLSDEQMVIVNMNTLEYEGKLKKASSPIDIYYEWIDYRDNEKEKEYQNKVNDEQENEETEDVEEAALFHMHNGELSMFSGTLADILVELDSFI